MEYCLLTIQLVKQDQNSYFHDALRKECEQKLSIVRCAHVASEYRNRNSTKVETADVKDESYVS